MCLEICMIIYIYVYVKYTTSSDTKRVDHEYQSFGLLISKLIGFNDPSLMWACMKCGPTNELGSVSFPKCWKKISTKSPLKFSNTSNTTAPGLGMTRLGCNWKSQQKAKKKQENHSRTHRPGATRRRCHEKWNAVPNQWLATGLFPNGKRHSKDKTCKATFYLPLHVILLHFWRSTKDFRAQDSQITNIRKKIKHSAGWPYL